MKLSAILIMLTVPLTVVGDSVPSSATEPSVVELPNGTKLQSVDFHRHIAPLLGTLGCNAADCHGSFDGRGDFRLSLFGYDPEHDYRSIVFGQRARRINRTSPKSSLILLKPTASVPHEGGQRFKTDSWQFRILAKWISQGARIDSANQTIKRLAIEPKQILLKQANDSAIVKVMATFGDGSKHDVTAFSEIRVQNDYVAESQRTRVIRKHPGDTSLIATYRGIPATARILVPNGNATFQSIAASNKIDDLVLRKLRRLNVSTSSLSSDHQFLRRLYLATIGALPSAEQTKSFLVNDDADKRTKLIDQLLHHPNHASLWATRITEIAGITIDATDATHGQRHAELWHAWLRNQFSNNVAYDRIVLQILSSTSRDESDVDQWIVKQAEKLKSDRSNQDFSHSTTDVFWRRGDPSTEYPVEPMAERTAAAFLGIRIDCAKCHQHPFDRWSQDDFNSFANVFKNVRYGISPELRSGMAKHLKRRRAARKEGKKLPALPRMMEIYHVDESMDAKILGGPVVTDTTRANQVFAEWLIGDGQFARNFVNRVWKIYFGRTFVEPVDAFSASNPASHPELLDWLADQFIESKFNVRMLERLILTSNVWQLSSVSTPSNRHDHSNFSRAYVRPLTAEVNFDILNDAIGAVDPEIAEMGFQRAIEIPFSKIEGGRLGRFMSIFERPARTQTCDCEQPSQPTVRQSLLMMSDSRLLEQIKEHRVKQVLSEMSEPEAIVNELFLSTLTRFPSQQERRVAIDRLLATDADKELACVDLFWALINTREFATNH